MNKSSKLKKFGLAAGALGAGLALAKRLRLKDVSFVGKTVLIAGGSRGLGLVLARHALAQGAKVSICGREKASLDRALAELKTKGAAVGTVCDLTVPGDVKRWIEDAKAAFGTPEVLIYNAGIMQVGPFESMEISDYQAAIQTHLFGALHALQLVVPQMKANGGGHIALIASMGGKRSVPHMLPYDASKFALVGLGEGLSIELEKDNIYVTTVCPATMRTGSPDNASFKGEHRTEFAWFSILDALPGVSVSAEYAAGKIFDAIAKRQSLLIYPWTAKIGLAASALFPSVYVKAMRRANRWMPQSSRKETFLGKDSHSEISPSLLTTLSEEAAEKIMKRWLTPKRQNSFSERPRSRFWHFVCNKNLPNVNPSMEELPWLKEVRRRTPQSRREKRRILKKATKNVALRRKKPPVSLGQP